MKRPRCFHDPAAVHAWAESEFDHAFDRASPNHRSRLGRWGVVLALCCLALAVRVAVIMQWPSIYYPDEIFQTIEQAHRMVFGYGLVPWEFRDGIRSPLIPWALAAILWPAERLWGGPEGYMTALRVVLAMLSLLSVIGAWRLGARCSALHGFIAGLVVATWYELVFFAGRALTEAIAASLLLFVLGLLANEEKECHVGRLILAGFFLGLCAVVRFHLLPGLAVAALWTARGDVKAKWLPLCIGGLIPIIAAGLADWVYWGAPFHSYLANFKVNILQGKAEEFGRNPWWEYIHQLLIVWAGIAGVMALLILVGARRFPMAFAVAVTILVSHSVITHKEYRFIIPAIGIAVVLAAIGSVEMAKALTRIYRPLPRVMPLPALLALFWLITSGSIVSSGIYDTYRIRWRGWIQAFLDIAKDPAACGIGFIDRHPFQTPGYAYLHRNIPLYFFHNVGIKPPVSPAELQTRMAQHSDAFNRIIVEQDKIGMTNSRFALRSCYYEWPDRNICVLERAGACVPALAVEANRMLEATGH